MGGARKEFGFLSHTLARDGKGTRVLAACWDTALLSSAACEHLPAGGARR